MEDFYKVDIFDTKGIEYIFVIIYLVALIVFWKVSGKQITRKIFYDLNCIIFDIIY